MKPMTSIIAVGLLLSAAPALAQFTTNGTTGEAVGQPAPAVGAPAINSDSDDDLSTVTSVTVLEAPDARGLHLSGPSADLTRNRLVADAIVKAGYSGDEILGYQRDGTSLTVYVKSSNRSNGSTGPTNGSSAP